MDDKPNGHRSRIGLAVTACFWSIATLVVLVLWITSYREVIYCAYHQQFEWLPGPRRGNGLEYEISWVYVLTPMAIVEGLLIRDWCRSR